MDRRRAESAENHGWLGRDVVQRQSGVRPDALAAHDLATGRKVTYRELEAEIARCAALLAALVTPGARVVVLARNSIHHIALYFACPRIGAAFVPLNWRLTGTELAVLVEDAAPELLVFGDEFEAEARAAIVGVPGIRTLRIGQPGDDEMAEAIASISPGPTPPVDPAAPSMLLYTSGTTGRPKGVIVTATSAFYASLNFIHVGELGPQHTQLCDVPLFHVVGLLAILHPTLMVGGSVLISDRFEAGATLARLGDPGLGISHYFCVPQMAQALAEHSRFAETDLTDMRIFTGGAPMPTALTLRLIEAGARPSNGYGMSENGTILGVPLDPEIARAKAGSVGVAAPAVEVRLVGPDGRDVADGEIGEIWLRGPSVTRGYWNQPEATAKTFEGDWFRTSDAARCDADGFYFIVDRWKDMYISGGENVYPAEIEAVLAALPAIAEVAVVGVPDVRWGEVGCVFAVPRGGAACAPADVTAWCDGRLARYKQPAHVRIVAALPRTASGKVRKDVLRQTFADSNELAPW